MTTNRKIRVGLVGAGYAARGVALQCKLSEEVELAGIVNRTSEKIEKIITELEIPRNSLIISSDVQELVKAQDIEVIVEATGDVAYGAEVALATIDAKKHIVLVNAELDATLGPLLRKKADAAGVIYTQGDGDQPGAIMNLIHEVERMGLQVVLAGNIKTFFDKYRTPATQKEWADANAVSPLLATNAVDGTKLSLEMATVANATGFEVATRGMKGYKAKHVDEAAQLFRHEIKNAKRGIVDFILGAQPAFGVFVLATTENTVMKEYLRMYKMGDGPLYTFYRPFHLCTLETVRSIVDAVHSKKATLAPNQLACEVIAVAKRDLEAGETLDGIGGYTVYGEIENRAVTAKNVLLPIGLSKDCVLKKSVKKDTPLAFSDVIIPQNRHIDSLYQEQSNLYI